MLFFPFNEWSIARGADFGGSGADMSLGGDISAAGGTGGMDGIGGGNSIGGIGGAGDGSGSGGSAGAGDLLICLVVLAGALAFRWFTDPRLQSPGPHRSNQRPSSLN